MHVIIDGYGGDPDQLADENAVRVILDEVPGMMGMTKITQPKVLVWADVFSCKDFDPQPVLDEIKRRFSLRNMDVQTLTRNLDQYPLQPREEMAAV
jgi:S-adenosylmethionine/arginine decarboxylase-like enzyme